MRTTSKEGGGVGLSSPASNRVRLRACVRAYAARQCDSGCVHVTRRIRRLVAVEIERAEIDVRFQQAQQLRAKHTVSNKTPYYIYFLHTEAHEKHCHQAATGTGAPTLLLPHIALQITSPVSHRLTREVHTKNSDPHQNPTPPPTGMNPAGASTQHIKGAKLAFSSETIVFQTPRECSGSSSVPNPHG